MKTEHIPLLAALIAATASLSAELYNQHSAGKLERRKWEQAQQDSLRTLVVDFAKELTTAHARSEWLVWHADHASDALTQKHLDTFDVES